MHKVAEPFKKTQPAIHSQGEIVILVSRKQLSGGESGQEGRRETAQRISLPPFVPLFLSPAVSLLWSVVWRLSCRCSPSSRRTLLSRQRVHSDRKSTSDNAAAPFAPMACILRSSPRKCANFLRASFSAPNFVIQPREFSRLSMSVSVFVYVFGFVPTP